MLVCRIALLGFTFVEFSFTREVLARYEYQSFDPMEGIGNNEIHGRLALITGASGG